LTDYRGGLTTAHSGLRVSTNGAGSVIVKPDSICREDISTNGSGNPWPQTYIKGKNPLRDGAYGDHYGRNYEMIGKPQPGTKALMRVGLWGGARRDDRSVQRRWQIVNSENRGLEEKLGELDAQLEEHKGYQPPNIQNVAPNQIVVQVPPDRDAKQFADFQLSLRLFRATVRQYLRSQDVTLKRVKMLNARILIDAKQAGIPVDKLCPDGKTWYHHAHRIMSEEVVKDQRILSDWDVFRMEHANSSDWVSWAKDLFKYVKYHPSIIIECFKNMSYAQKLPIMLFFGYYATPMLYKLLKTVLRLFWNSRSGKLSLLGSILYTFMRRRAPRDDIMSEEISDVGDYCTGMNDLTGVTLGEGCTINRLPRFICKPVRYQMGFTINKQVWIPRTCTHNELTALVYRQLLPAVGESQLRVKAWRTGRQTFLQEFMLPVFGPIAKAEEVVQYSQRIGGSRGDVLRNAWEVMAAGTFDVNVNTKMFVKVEWLTGKVISKRYPRAISGKHDTYLMYGGPTYYKWQKDVVAANFSNFHDCASKDYIYTGGMNATEIGMLITYFEMQGFHALEGDYSKYDGHTEIEAIHEELNIYSACGMPADIHKLMRLAMTRRKGISKTGIVYSYTGKFDSGLINTSLGNTLRGFMALAYFKQKLKDSNLWQHGQRIVVLQLGDDNVILCRHKIPDCALLFAQWANDLGMILEIIERDDYDLLEYCSMRFWNTGDMRVLGPKPGRVLSKSFLPHRSVEDVREHIFTVAQGYKYFNWVPVLGAVVDSICPNYPTVLPPQPDWQVTLDHKIDVDADTIATQFYKIYGFYADEFKDSVNSVDWSRPGFRYTHPLFDTIMTVDGAMVMGADQDAQLHNPPRA